MDLDDPSVGGRESDWRRVGGRPRRAAERLVQFGASQIDVNRTNVLQAGQPACGGQLVRERVHAQLQGVELEGVVFARARDAADPPRRGSVRPA